MIAPKNDPDFQIYDTVRYAGNHNWYVIGKQGDTVTLLAKDAEFGRSKFDEDSPDYATSFIRNRLNTAVLQELLDNGAKLLPMSLPDIGCRDMVAVLSADEAHGLPKKLREFCGAWWLRTAAGRFDYSAVYVAPSGGIYDSGFGDGVVHRQKFLRPVIKVSMAELI